MIGVTQSGETRDTVAALRLARDLGAPTIALTNAALSQATREADAVLRTHAGLEVGVAATKTFTSQVVAFALFALYMARARGARSTADLDQIESELCRLPGLVTETIADVSEPVAAAAARHADRELFMYLGRDLAYPVACEGALKMKEISYIPADAYPAGEMKHGPLALLSEGTPVVCVATDSERARQVALEPLRSAGARRDHSGRRIRRPTPRPRLRGRGVLATSRASRSAAGAGRGAAATPCHRGGRSARPERRPASQPCKDSDGGIMRRLATVMAAAAVMAVVTGAYGAQLALAGTCYRQGTHKARVVEGGGPRRRRAALGTTRYAATGSRLYRVLRDGTVIGQTAGRKIAIKVTPRRTYVFTVRVVSSSTGVMSPCKAAITRTVHLPQADCAQEAHARAAIGHPDRGEVAEG